ncbi:MAG: hypothetical protein JO192_05450, partial [Candidatus Eremiobacteraeota bacterium]|nr:hypothetical protein [Candidatus Eremiobacteraeota bacterium]
RWLVQTVGLLVTCVAISLAAGTRRDLPSQETLVLAVSSALALASVDVVHTVRGRISPVYLADAVAELLLVAGLCGTRC